MNKLGWLFLTILSIFLTVSTCKGEDTGLLGKCSSALSACDDLSQAQDAQIKELTDEVAAWKKQAEAPLAVPPITLLAALSGAAGGALGGEVQGKSGLVGGALGAVIGALVGLALEGLGQ